ncbi:hypothetical protein DL546_008641 [Coniochaeta pulveracea]|uniref:Uncharacterized protein n=1 Tax=Coniochaeta pulveracea TaxID=177199 RepID=A0A420YEJ2_9PEZI|nr:hypothetical protein DL546_008641 [Coniochaeta pulveracea]
MKEVIAAAALSDKRLRRYFAESPRWPSYHEHESAGSEGSLAEDEPTTEGTEEAEGSSDDGHSRHAGAGRDAYDAAGYGADVASSSDEDPVQDTENEAEDDEDEQGEAEQESVEEEDEPQEVAEQPAADLESADDEDEEQEDAEDWDQPQPFFSDDTDGEGDDGGDKEEEGGVVEAGNVEQAKHDEADNEEGKEEESDEDESEAEESEAEESEAEESEAEESEEESQAGVSHANGSAHENGTEDAVEHCLDVDLSESSHQLVIADSQGERSHLREPLARNRDTETVIPDAQGEQSTGTDADTCASLSGGNRHPQDNAEETSSPGSDVAMPAESEDDEDAESLETPKATDRCSGVRKALSDTCDDDEPPEFALCQGFPQYGIPPLVIRPLTGLATSSIHNLKETLALWKGAGQAAVSHHEVPGKRRQTGDTAPQGPAKRRRGGEQSQRAGSDSIGQPGSVRLEVRISSRRDTP